MVLTVGNAATDRSSSITGYTVLDINNPCTSDGTITQIQFYMNSSISSFDIYVGIFRNTSGTNYECIHYVQYANGEYSTGLNTKTVSWTVQSGDLIGFYSKTGSAIDRDLTGSGYYYCYGNVFGTTQTYSLSTDKTLSLGGTGTETGGTPTNPQIKLSGTFGQKPIKFKTGGSFVEKTFKVKVGGTFQ